MMNTQLHTNTFLVFNPYKFKQAGVFALGLNTYRMDALYFGGRNYENIDFSLRQYIKKIQI